MPVLRSALAGTKTLQSQGQRFETGAEAVSYTHLDVYKRQELGRRTGATASV